MSAVRAQMTHMRNSTRWNLMKHVIILMTTRPHERAQYLYNEVTSQQATLGSCISGTGAWSTVRSVSKPDSGLVTSPSDLNSRRFNPMLAIKNARTNRPKLQRRRSLTAQKGKNMRVSRIQTNKTQRPMKRPNSRKARSTDARFAKNEMEVVNVEAKVDLPACCRVQIKRSASPALMFADWCQKSEYTNAESHPRPTIKNRLRKEATFMLVMPVMAAKTTYARGTDSTMTKRPTMLRNKLRKWRNMYMSTKMLDAAASFMSEVRTSMNSFFNIPVPRKYTRNGHSSASSCSPKTLPLTASLRTGRSESPLNFDHCSLISASNLKRLAALS
mmetsp:Transcript_17975/g.35147  ORF Transcript_17975/g.35147 Transcript_17975/m.35147 type:complete len:330 (-) Transcript_17975:1149-2138(-)